MSEEDEARDYEVAWKAVEFMSKTYKSELDRSGNLALLHPMRVGQAGKTPEEMAAGFLHDVVEDFGVDPAFLRTMFPDDVVDAVVAVSRRDNETYSEFIERIAGSGELAIRVKLLDLQDNLERVMQLPEDTAIGLKKRYEKARQYLLEVWVRKNGR